MKEFISFCTVLCNLQQILLKTVHVPDDDVDDGEWPFPNHNQISWGVICGFMHDVDVNVGGFNMPEYLLCF